MVSPETFTSVLVGGFVKQPAILSLKTPGSCSPIVAGAGTNPTTGAAKRRLPIFVRVNIKTSFQLQFMLDKARASS